MKRLTILGIVACVGLLFAPAAVIGNPAGPPGGLDVNDISVYRFVGYSTATTTGNAGGFVGIYQICQNEFGPMARMCTTEEFFKSPNIEDPPLAGQGAAWVEPHFIAAFPNPSDPTKTVFVEAFSGKMITPANLRCGGWTLSGDTIDGTVIRRSFNNDTPGVTVTTAVCDGNLHVTCCIP